MKFQPIRTQDFCCCCMNTDTQSSCHCDITTEMFGMNTCCSLSGRGQADPQPETNVNSSLTIEFLQFSSADLSILVSSSSCTSEDESCSVSRSGHRRSLCQIQLKLELPPSDHPFPVSRLPRISDLVLIAFSLTEIPNGLHFYS